MVTLMLYVIVMQRRCLLLDDGWFRVATTIGFLRANHDHELKYCILALLPTVCAMAMEEATLNKFDDAAREKVEKTTQSNGISADKFISTRFCVAELVRADKRNNKRKTVQ